jgi:hypothetical protein
MPNQDLRRFDSEREAWAFLAECDRAGQIVVG